MPTTFLDLPWEVRLMIYTAVLESELPPPSCPSESRETRLEWSSGNLWEFHGKYPLRLGPVACSGLLFTSHEIHAEMFDAINRFKGRGQLRYKLDLMIKEKCQVYYNWLSIPILAPRVDIIDVDVRNFGSPRWGSKFWDEPPLLASILLALLRRFLEAGPVFMDPSKPKRDIKVGTIALNFLTTDDSDDMVEGPISPEIALKSLKASLKRMITTADAACHVARRIRLMLNGKGGRSGN